MKVDGTRSTAAGKFDFYRLFRLERVSRRFCPDFSKAFSHFGKRGRFRAKPRQDARRLLCSSEKTLFQHCVQLLPDGLFSPARLSGSQIPERFVTPRSSGRSGSEPIESTDKADPHAYVRAKSMRAEVRASARARRDAIQGRPSAPKFLLPLPDKR